MGQQLTRQSMESDQSEKDADQAVADVQRKYGADLSAFFSDVQRQLRLERSQEPPEQRPPEQPPKKQD